MTDRGKRQGSSPRRPTGKGARGSDRTTATPTSSSAFSTPEQRRLSVEDLKVFRLAHDLALQVYQATTRFPREEMFGLTAQLRRASVAVPANLAEGSARNKRTEYRDFVQVAKGSAAAARYHVLLAHALGYVTDAERDALRDGYDQTCRLLARLAQTLDREALLKR
jgi:four helix bundle protein